MNAFHVTRAKALLENAVQIYSQSEIEAAIERVAQELNHRYERLESPDFPLVLSVMGGAVVFTGHLLPQLNFPLEFDYIHVTRYGLDDQGGKVVWKVVPRSNVAGRTVIVLDDILDQGETLAHVKQRLLEMGATEVVIAVLADKAIEQVKPIMADHIGVTLPNQFVVGCGMDAYGYWRNLPGIWSIQMESKE